ncbi:hypothetical protein DB895_06270 [Flavobacterium psychrotolerans]|uniref:Uncharacterized protein n=1 Tax=Flavobacterium psychrotolerans TaxID=2169410 RepID=A0A2U1JKA7_9FLAO|nr:hypothetical protein DB895_06270 [Flavobacterium psychrotolerans]
MVFMVNCFLLVLGIRIPFLIHNYFNHVKISKSIILVGDMFLGRVVTPNIRDVILYKILRGLQHFKITSLDKAVQYPTYGVFCMLKVKR